MKKLIILITVVLFYVACKQNNLPEGIIKKDKMLNVMLDMQLSDAALNQVYNSDSMKMYAHTRYNYVFYKYKIDSAMFTNSLNYYSKDPSELDSMYTLVSDSLLRIEEILKPKLVNYDDSLKIQKQKIYAYVLKSFATNAAKSSSSDFYALDAKNSYKKYRYVLDSIKSQDSLALKQAEQLQQNNQD